MKKVLRRFDGGITDYIFEGSENQAEILDNFLIGKDRGLITRNGSQIYNSDAPQISDGNQRIGQLVIFNDQLLIQSATKIEYINNDVMTTLQGPAGGNVFDTCSVNNYMSSAYHNKHLYVVADSYAKPTKIYKDGSTWNVVTAGLPTPTAPTVTPDNDDSKEHIYRIIYEYEYTINGTTFLDLSDYVQVEVSNSADMSGVGHYNQLSVISSVSGYNYDISNIKVRVYRTVHNGTTFYYVGEVTNGTTTFEDTVTDDDLQSNALLYAQGGVVGDEAPPLAKYIIIADGIGWYLNCKIDGEIKGNRARQSLRNNIDACPEDFYVDVDDDITGGGVVGVFPIVFTKDKIFRFEGYADSLGRGATASRLIYDKTGCLSNNSIVTTEKGLYFAGKNGFYFTDGRQVVRISQNLLDLTYPDLVETEEQQLRISGKYDKKNKRIYWTVQEEATECDRLYVFDETFGSFSTMSGEESFRPTAIEFENDTLIRADNRGYLFSHNDINMVDPIVDVSSPVADWLVQTIIYKWKHIAFDFGDPDAIKFVNKVTVGAQNPTNLDLQINSYDDGNITAKQLKEIEFMNLMTWNNPEWIWSGTRTDTIQSYATNIITFDSDHAFTSDHIGSTVNIYEADGSTLRGSDTIASITDSDKIELTNGVAGVVATDQIFTVFDSDAVWEEKLLISKTRRMVAGKLRTKYKQLELTNAYTTIDWSDQSSTATLSLGATCTATLDNISINYAWAPRCEGYDFRYNDGTGWSEWYEITSRNSDTVIQFDGPNLGTNPANVEWEIAGYHKGQRLQLNSVIYTYTPFMDKGGYYSSDESDGN